MTFLRGRAFRRKIEAASPAVSRASFQRELPQAVVALQDAAMANLLSLLGDGPPLPLDRERLAVVFPSAAPAAPRTLSDASRVLANPAETASIFDIGRGFGHEILVPEVFRQAFSEGAFRFRIAAACHHFLCDKVIFHPGPVPEARFSPWGMGLLVTSQAQHGTEIGAEVLRKLREHVQTLAAPVRAVLPWDQWLVRRMAANGAWIVPEGLTTLQWVAWRQGAGISPEDASSVPECWASILDLTP